MKNTVPVYALYSTIFKEGAISAADPLVRFVSISEHERANLRLTRAARSDDKDSDELGMVTLANLHSRNMYNFGALRSVLALHRNHQPYVPCCVCPFCGEDYADTVTMACSTCGLTLCDSRPHYGESYVDDEQALPELVVTINTTIFPTLMIAVLSEAEKKMESHRRCIDRASDRMALILQPMIDLNDLDLDLRIEDILSVSSYWEFEVSRRIRALRILSEGLPACKWCGKPAKHTHEQECETCWHLHNALIANREIAVKMLNLSHEQGETI